MEKYFKRAEELKESHKSSFEHSVDIQDYELIEWLIEQAKQTQKLLDVNQTTVSIIKAANVIDTQNRKLRKALEFYADEKTYQLGVSISMGSAFPKHEPIKYDKGEKAREVLKVKQHE